uniref:alanine transaminase n=1 Tax=Acrobeloides nanus TaxID=290746 RepID=A0A914BUL4_9BILA
MKDLEKAYKNAEKKGIVPKILVLINPGNPTGQVMSKEKIRELVEFAFSRKLLIIADEVYQSLVYDENSEFHSVKKVMVEMGEPYCNMELASVHSASKGYFNESGLRAGYVEFFNFEPPVLQTLFTVMSLRFVTTSLGQVALDCLLNPPKPGDESYETWNNEKQTIIKYLREKSLIFHENINSIPGLECNPIQSSMYYFTKIDMPSKAIEESKKLGMDPDFMYTTQLLQKTGVADDNTTRKECGQNSVRKNTKVS